MPVTKHCWTLNLIKINKLKCNIYKTCVLIDFFFATFLRCAFDASKSLTSFLWVFSFGAVGVSSL